MLDGRNEVGDSLVYAFELVASEEEICLYCLDGIHCGGRCGCKECG
mgnify:CR=1 FL=1